MSVFDPDAAARSAMRLLADTSFTGGKPIMIVGDDAGRRDTLEATARGLQTATINLSLDLAQALIDSGQTGDLAGTIAGMAPDFGPLLLDRIHLLMLPQLHVNAVDVICRVARRRPVCVSWPGRVEAGRLRYANQDHSECLDEDAARVLVIDLSTNEGIDP